MSNADLPFKDVCAADGHADACRTGYEPRLYLGDLPTDCLQGPNAKRACCAFDSSKPLGVLVPERGIEPPTFSLRMSCSTD
jgi:hypothetical protein